MSRSRSHSPVPSIDNPLPHVLPEGKNAAPLEVIGSTASDKVVIIMVGLPATGKTHIAKRICRFLSFFHDIPSQIFNVGDYRRQLCGPQMKADFYSPDNDEGLKARTMACDAALEDLMEVSFLSFLLPSFLPYLLGFSYQLPQSLSLTHSFSLSRPSLYHIFKI